MLSFLLPLQGLVNLFPLSENREEKKRWKRIQVWNNSNNYLNYRQLSLKGKIIKKHTGGEKCDSRWLEEAPSMAGVLPKVSPKALKDLSVGKTAQHQGAWFVSVHTHRWGGVAAVKSLTRWHIVENAPKLFISCSFPLSFWGVKTNPTPASFYDIVWRSAFWNRIPPSCVCLSVKGIIETDSQITNLWDAWCYPEQTQEVCVQCNGQLEAHHILPNLVWQWFAKWTKSSTYKTLSLEQRKEVERRRKHTDERNWLSYPACSEQLSYKLSCCYSLSCCFHLWQFQTQV